MIRGRHAPVCEQLGVLDASPGQPRVMLLLILVAFGLRLLRLGWQPLWWDEGYSVYFATEPMTRLLWLTAQDIHPPLYYTLLKIWFSLLSTAQPEAARILSVLLALPAVPLSGYLARRLMPKRPSAAMLVETFLAINPIHLFYSQEVRMYGFAVSLSVLATIFCFWWLQAAIAGKDARTYGILYILSSVALFHTLYYGALVMAAHWFIGAWLLYRERRLQWSAGWIPLAVLFACAPWTVYTVPYLAEYVGDKVTSDQDTALPLFTYVNTHLTAFTAGHIASPNNTIGNDTIRWLRPLGLLGILLLIGASLYIRIVRPNHPKRASTAGGLSLALLLALVTVPFTMAFGINLWWPFFPDGGERLLLITLPFVWLLIGGLLTAPTVPAVWRYVPGVLLLLAAGSGTVTYFTLPRYVEHDYRPMIAQVMQQGKPEDTVVAIFPWQIGYWRAYSPRDSSGALLPPQPAPLNQQALVWNNALSSQIEHSLANGAVWFPAPLSFGSTLPAQIEQFLRQHAANLVNQWYGQGTRLTAWSQPKELTPVRVSFQAGSQHLDITGVGPPTVASANDVFYIRLIWSNSTSEYETEVVLRIVDQDDTIWATRTVNLSQEVGIPVLEANDNVEQDFGLIVPASIPPGAHRVQAALSTRAYSETGSDPTPARSESGFVTIAPITITLPSDPLPVPRLPIDRFVANTPPFGGTRLLGVSGMTEQTTILAGAEVPVRVFLQAVASPPNLEQILVGVRAQDGRVLAQWQGWPLPSYTPDTWKAGALVQVPVSFYLPPDIVTGTYNLGVRLLDQAHATSDWTLLTNFHIQRRLADFSRLEPSHLLAHTAQIGTHARLYGYDLLEQQDRLVLYLYWEIIEPLLPPHHIFVHLVRDGEIISQSDGPPHAQQGNAPSGTWLPGEYLRTEHILTAEDTLGELAASDVELEIGLYAPETEARLPVSIAGEPAGDHVTIEPRMFQ